MSFSQQLGKTFKLSLKAENILNPDIEQVWQSDYIPEEATAGAYTKGVTFSVSLSAAW